MRIEVVGLTGIPEVREGDDVADLLLDALDRGGLDLADGDVLVVSSKIVSKAAGLRAPAEGKVAVVLAESRRVVAERLTPGGVTRVVEALAGPVLAAAGVDASNTGSTDEILLLPHDPDAEAARLREALLADRPAVRRLGVVVSDTAGRPWRVGQQDFALGAAGVRVLDDLRGQADADGRELAVTARAVADELAAAADLVKGKSANVPAALVRGLAEATAADEHAHGEHAHGEDGPDTGGGDGSAEGARRLVRADASDWFAHGHLEAVRRSLGVEAGTPLAVEVGLPPASGREDVGARLERACAVATHPEAIGAHLGNLGPVEAYLVQTGVRVEADDDFALGVVVARLCAALVAEGLPARLVRRTAGPGRVRAELRITGPVTGV